MSNRDLTALKPPQNVSEITNYEGRSIFEIQDRNQPKELDIELVQQAIEQNDINMRETQALLMSTQLNMPTSPTNQGFVLSEA